MIHLSPPTLKKVPGGGEAGTVSEGSFWVLKLEGYPALETVFASVSELLFLKCICVVYSVDNL